MVTSVGVMLNDTPLQLVSVSAFTLAFGLMITVTLNVEPTQLVPNVPGVTR